MVTYYNKKDLVNFGLYLLSDERKASFEEGTRLAIKQGSYPLPTEERLKFVHDADLRNWVHYKKEKSITNL